MEYGNSEAARVLAEFEFAISQRDKAKVEFSEANERINAEKAEAEAAYYQIFRDARVRHRYDELERAYWQAVSGVDRANEAVKKALETMARTPET